MDPIALQVGPLVIRWYGILMVLGFIIGYLLFKKIAREKNLKIDVDEFFFYVILVTIIGARLFHVFFYNFNYFSSNLIKIFYIWEGGLSSHGAIIGNILLIWIYSKKKKINFYDISDILVIPFALGAAFVRIGNFINQELVGKVTDSIFGYKFDNYEKLRHPVQLYQAFSNFLLFGILYFYRNLKRGYVSWLFLLLYSIFRFFTEFYKDLPYLYGLSLAQYVSIIIFLISGWFLIKLKER